jgi:hypothetical protein
MPTQRSKYEIHRLLSEAIDGKSQKTPEALAEIRSIIKLYRVEKSLPHLALKAYSYLEDKDKFRELLKTSTKLNKGGSRHYILRNLEGDNSKILEFMLKTSEDIPLKVLNSAISRAATMGYNKSLEILLNQIGIKNLNEETLKFAGIGAVIDEKINTLKIVCRYAKASWLKAWIKEIHAIPATISMGTKESCKKGERTINDELTKRKVLKSLKTSGTVDIPI